MRLPPPALIALACLFMGTGAFADDHKLRIISWADYVPAEVVAAFKQETGFEVELTLSNNEEMISKLRATGGAGFDLAQPSIDRIEGPQIEFGIYKPIDVTKIKLQQFQPELLEIVRKNATIDGKLYALPYLWGTDGLVVNTDKAAQVKDYPDLCRPELKGKTAVRLRRPTLIAFAFAAGQDPFKLYGDAKAYGALMDKVGATLAACKSNLKFFYDNKDQLLNGMRSGEVVAAMMWDTGGWKLHQENAAIQFLVPRSGALGWVDTYALPARTRNEGAAYAWINFTSRPEVAAKIAKAVGSFSAARGTDGIIDAKLKAASLQNIHWYPSIPAGIENLEGRVLDRIKAAN